MTDGAWTQQSSREEGEGHGACLKIKVNLSRKSGLLKYLLHAPSLNVENETFDSRILPSELREYCKELLSEIEEIPIRSSQERDIARNRLEAIGLAAYRELIPSALGVRLRRLREQVETLSIETDEIWIPWEILRFQTNTLGSTNSGSFFGEIFNIARWPTARSSVSVFPLRRIAVVLAAGSDLPCAAEEIKFIKSLEDQHRKVEEIPARFKNIREAFETGYYDTWHFVGHGYSTEGSKQCWSLDLEDGRLKSIDVGSWVVSSDGTSPLVFMNACRTGQQGQSLTRAAGWAKEFIEAGAGAFIGANWNTTDRYARDFAQTFYLSFIGGSTIGKAIRKARLETKKNSDGDPTWLAYCSFADPIATNREAVSEVTNPSPTPWPSGERIRSFFSIPRRSLLFAMGGAGILSWAAAEADRFASDLVPQTARMQPEETRHTSASEVTQESNPIPVATRESNSDANAGLAKKEESAPSLSELALDLPAPDFDSIDESSRPPHSAPVLASSEESPSLAFETEIASRSEEPSPLADCSLSDIPDVGEIRLIFSCNPKGQTTNSEQILTNDRKIGDDYP